MTEDHDADFPDEDVNDGRPAILIVDDEPMNLTVLGRLLQPRYRVRVANSGERALRAARRSPRPDLILLDIMMPEMDGFAVLRHLREDDRTRDIPVMFVTAMQDEEAELHGFEAGAADYLHKPIRGAIVLSRVQAQLDAKAARDMLRKNSERLTHQVAEGTHALEQAQLQLMQAEKLSAMGQLAAGVAHEINNPVGFVGSNLGTLEKYLQDIFAVVAAYEEAEAAHAADPAFDRARGLKRDCDYEFLKKDIAALLAESKEGVARVRRIVQDLKDFSRSGDTAWQWADLHQGLDSTLNIAWNELKYKCTVTRHYGDLPQVYCLPSQLNQVFLNLLVNAAQAIESRGEVTIATERLADAPGDGAVRIRIADTGCGIPPEHLERIFDPFFTTKPVGKGTGLGLSLTWSIIDRHQGRIEVASTPGKGTEFTITLPVRPAGIEAKETP